MFFRIKVCIEYNIFKIILILNKKMFVFWIKKIPHPVFLIILYFYYQMKMIGH